MALTGRGSQLEQETVNARIEANQQTIEELTAKVEGMKIAFDVMSDAPELNMSNYDHDDVALLNTAMCEAWAILNESLNPKEQA